MPLTNALNVMARWPQFAERYRWSAADRPELGCFGTGYNGWGVQTNQKYLGALAAMAVDPNLDEQACGMGREALLGRVLEALRFSFESHVTGAGQCTDGTTWGHTWISGLGIERMMHGIDAIHDQLTEEDREALRQMLISEADALLEMEVRGTVWASEGGNRPESNIWNGAILARTAMMYSDEPHVADWIEKAHVFLINGISVRADAEDDSVVAGKPVCERHVGPNFFDHYALDHHGYLNVGYMVICLSNVVMLHYGFALRGKSAPESLYHHVGDLWPVVKQLIFSDGRLCRIGGDTRQRYCYCQDYLLPTLIFAADYLADPHAATLARRQIDLIAAEQQFSGDGSFLSPRLSHFRASNHHYYCRLESDRAVVLSMAAYWGRHLELEEMAESEFEESFEESVRGGWEEFEHGALFHRSPTRIASWSWRANLAESPQGLCLPPSDGHLAEWAGNMAGAVVPAADQCGAGKREERLLRTREWFFEGGFGTVGEVIDGAKVYIGEGWSAAETARHQIAFVALPDDHTVVRLEHARVPERRVYLAGVEGVRLNVPNDVFNGMSREYTTENGVEVCEAQLGRDRVVRLDSRWVNVDGVVGVIGVYGGDSWSVAQQGERTGGCRGSILTDVLCYPLRRGFWDVYGPAVVLDTGCIVISSVDAARTKELFASGSAEQLACAEPDGRAVRVRGMNGTAYVVVANFSQTEERVTITVGTDTSMHCPDDENRVTSRDGVLPLEMAPGDATLFVVCE